MATCKSCGEEIGFVKMQSGKFMPVNGMEQETYYLDLNDRAEPQMMVVTENGACFKGRIGRSNEDGVMQVKGRESHFATCPFADSHRKEFP